MKVATTTDVRRSDHPEVGTIGPGALEVKHKERIALAIAVSSECDGCIASHSRAAAKAGATTSEAAEALGVTILMGGGPATIWAPRAYAAFCEFVDDSHSTP
ncbi:MAG: carboxymuconolactone decarboxylase family protein [Candidatus Nanopelagicales bacterium]